MFVVLRTSCAAYGVSSNRRRRRRPAPRLSRPQSAKRTGLGDQRCLACVFHCFAHHVGHGPDYFCVADQEVMRSARGERGVVGGLSTACTLCRGNTPGSRRRHTRAPPRPPLALGPGSRSARPRRTLTSSMLGQSTRDVLLNQRPAGQGPQDAGIRHSAFRDLGAPMPFSRVTFAAARPILPTAGISTKPTRPSDGPDEPSPKSALSQHQYRQNPLQAVTERQDRNPLPPTLNSKDAGH